MTSNNETNSNGRNWQKPETIEIPKHFCELPEFKRNPHKNSVLVELEFEHIADFALSIHGLIAMHKRGLLHLAENAPTPKPDNETIYWEMYNGISLIERMADKLYSVFEFAHEITELEHEHTQSKN